MWDVDGNEYTDYNMRFGVLIGGHAHSLVVDAIKEQAEKGTDFDPNLPVHITQFVGPVGFVPPNIVGTILQHEPKSIQGVRPKPGGFEPPALPVLDLRTPDVCQPAFLVGQLLHSLPQCVSNHPRRSTASLQTFHMKVRTSWTAQTTEMGQGILTPSYWYK
jgi:hypothetical protein